MKNTDAAAFHATLTAVYQLYGKPLSNNVVDMWWAALKPCDFAAVKDALNRHAVNPDNGQFLPKPADVVKLIDGGTADIALIAWAKLEQGIQRAGTYRSVVFDDAIIHRCVADMGGWCKVCSVTVDEWPFERNRFVTLYRGYAGRRIAFDYPPYLGGLAEANNVQNGFPVEPPVLLGNADRARQVMNGGSENTALAVTVMKQLEHREVA